MGASSFSGNFANKLPQLTSAAPAFPSLSNQTLPSYSNLLANLNSPGDHISKRTHNFSKQTGLETSGHCVFFEILLNYKNLTTLASLMNAYLIKGNDAFLIAEGLMIFAHKPGSDIFLLKWFSREKYYKNKIPSITWPMIVHTDGKGLVLYTATLKCPKTSKSLLNVSLTLCFYIIPNVLNKHPSLKSWSFHLR